MKRIELFEFEDLEWVPSVIRTGATNLLVVFHRMMGTADVLSLLIQKARKKYDFNQVVDLGSGSGGAMIDCFKLINDSSTELPMKLILSDLYPNPKVVKEINEKSLPNVEYIPTSINATQIETVPSGLKTMIASFHHMNPRIAKQILKSAQENREPILIYELAKNNIPTLLWWLLLPISLVILFVMSWIMTPFVKQLSLQQILFTYIIPIIPILYAWDGQASLMRTYTFDDLKELIGENEDKGYHWEIGDAKKSNGKKSGYYLMGSPVNNQGKSL